MKKLFQRLNQKVKKFNEYLNEEDKDEKDEMCLIRTKKQAILVIIGAAVFTVLYAHIPQIVDYFKNIECECKHVKR